MEQRRLGRSGLLVSAIGLGCNNFGGMIAGMDAARAASVIHAALDAGITLFDTSDSYGVESGSEKVLGEVLGPRRKHIVLATKFASPLNRAVSTRVNGSRGYILGAAEDSLRRLRTDWIDLYQYHFPDPLTPREETLRALEDLVRQGKVRYIGCSNLPAWQLVDADWIARTRGWSPFLSTQAEYNLLAREAEKTLLPALEELGMSLLPYFPLANGLLTGKYRKGAPQPGGTRMELPIFRAGLTEERLERVERLVAFAEARGRTLLELAFAWLLQRPCVASVIAGATSAEQVRANAATPGWRLTPEDLAEIDALRTGEGSWR